MKKCLLTVFAPLAVLSLAFTSCNKGGGGFNPKRRDIELERVDYANHSNYSGARNYIVQDTNTGFAKVILEAKKNQAENSVYKLKENGLGKGTMTTNIELDIGGKGTLILEKEPPIDINSVKGGLGDTVTTSWSIDDGYIKSVDTLGGVNYIVREGEGEGANYWRCVKTNVEDNNYRLNITDYVNAAGGFENVVMMETAYNSSISHSEEEIGYQTGTYLSEFLGLDLTGFGGNYVPGETAEKSYSFTNSLAIGSILTDPLTDFYILDNVLMLDILDIITTAIDYLLPDIGIDLIEFAYDKDAKTASAGSVDIGFRKENLSLIKEVYDAVASYFKTELKVELPFVIEESSGNGTIDFFTAYEDNFIRQQELVIDVTNTNFVLSPNLESESPLPMLVDLKGANVRAIINANTEKDKCLIDNVKLTDYIDATPTPEIDK